MEEKRLFELAEMWLAESGAGFFGTRKVILSDMKNTASADYDISDVWKNQDGDYHIEIIYFESGKYYSTSRTMPKEFALGKNREEAFAKIGI